MKKYNYVRKTFSWEGKRYTAYGKTEMEALQKMVELKEALKRGEKAINDKTTVDRWFREWIEVYKKPSGITEKALICTCKNTTGISNRYWGACL
ncbi:MAG: hypothetical protein ACLR1T_09220 [Evtepia gabavorous]